MFYYLILAGLLLLACCMDCYRRQIDHWICGAVMLVGVVYRLSIYTQNDAAVWSSIVGFIAVFVGLLCWFHWGLLGGGDIKLIMSLIPWFTFGDYLMFLIFLTILGGLFAVMFTVAVTLKCIYRVGLWHVSIHHISFVIKRSTIPYALPISIAAIFLLFKEFAV
jgi:prepilin peptidase CpaA